jgi:hypothetical protein
MGQKVSWQLAVGSWQEGAAKNAKDREEEKKISLRFPQTFETTALFLIHINCKRFFTAGLYGPPRRGVR